MKKGLRLYTSVTLAILIPNPLKLRPDEKGIETARGAGIRDVEVNCVKSEAYNED